MKAVKEGGMGVVVPADEYGIGDRGWYCKEVDVPWLSRYEVYKGNGDYMFSYGYGRDFKEPSDIGETYDFVYGGPQTIPKGAEIGMAGMKVGGRRKILVRIG